MGNRIYSWLCHQLTATSWASPFPCVSLTFLTWKKSVRVGQSGSVRPRGPGCPWVSEVRGRSWELQITDCRCRKPSGSGSCPSGEGSVEGCVGTSNMRLLSFSASPHEWLECPLSLRFLLMVPKDGAFFFFNFSEKLGYLPRVTQPGPGFAGDICSLPALAGCPQGGLSTHSLIHGCRGRSSAGIPAPVPMSWLVLETLLNLWAPWFPHLSDGSNLRSICRGSRG